MTKDLIRESDFEDYGEVRVDSKNRVTLGPPAQGRVSAYKIYRNSLGQYILDPQVTIPAHEAWLFQNPKALSAVKQGLADAKARKLVRSKEDFSKYKDAE